MTPEEERELLDILESELAKLEPLAKRMDPIAWQTLAVLLGVLLLMMVIFLVGVR
jgi:hypothetical protein